MTIRAGEKRRIISSCHIREERWEYQRGAIRDLLTGGWARREIVLLETHTCPVKR